MKTDEGLVSAFLLDGKGGGKLIRWDEIRDYSPTDGLLWMHLDFTHPNTERWLKEESGLDPIISAALMADESRPRSVMTNDGLLISLRGVNMNPGADPEDMVSIRLWIDGNRIISTRRRLLLSVDDLRHSIKEGHGPCTTGEFLVHIADRMSERMANIIDDLDESVDDLEEEVLTSESFELRTRIAEIRREAISLRRYLAPQRDVMSRLYNERAPWLDEDDRMQLREIADRTMRYVEDLDSARDRANVTQEELMNRLSEQLNRRMYVLSIVAAIFLPLGFLTGLLGINVGGIPGADYKDAFIIFVVLLLFVVALQIWVFKVKKWM